MLLHRAFSMFQIFQGNVDHQILVVHYLYPRIIARKIRLYAGECGSDGCCIRMELWGCYKGIGIQNKAFILSFLTEIIVRAQLWVTYFFRAKQCPPAFLTCNIEVSPLQRSIKRYSPVSV